jgi:hypothetical protein
MKRAAKQLWSIFVVLLLSTAMFLFTISPARAPHGGKNSLGGRTIASLQEREFDQKLLQFQLCYSVNFNAERATPERRRVCKALLVHRLEKFLANPGSYLKAPMEFHCEDTVFSRPKGKDDDLIHVAMQPNKEFEAIDVAIQANLEPGSVGESLDRKAKQACSFLTDCKLAMGPQGLSFRKLAQCFSTGNVTHRKILLDEVAAMLFKAKEQQNKILYADLLLEAQ